MYLNTVFKYNVFKYCPALPGLSFEFNLKLIEVDLLHSSN